MAIERYANWHMSSEAVSEFIDNWAGITEIQDDFRLKIHQRPLVAAFLDGKDCSARSCAGATIIEILALFAGETLCWIQISWLFPCPLPANPRV
jgi:hypothetical protein